MARIMYSDVVASNLAMAPLSNNIVKRRIKKILLDVLQQTIWVLSNYVENFSLQLDETTDIGNDA